MDVGLHMLCDGVVNDEKESPFVLLDDFIGEDRCNHPLEFLFESRLLLSAVEACVGYHVN